MIPFMGTSFAGDGNFFTNWTDTQIERWIFYLIARYGPYPVVWMPVIEYNEDGVLADWQKMHDFSDDADPWDNPVTGHPLSDGTSDPTVDCSTYLNVCGDQFFGTPEAHYDESSTWRDAENNPFINLEHGYDEGDGTGSANDQVPLDVIKDQLALASFSAGVNYGHRNVWWGNVSTLAQLRDSLTIAVGVTYVTNLAKFMRGETGRTGKNPLFTDWDSHSKLTSARFQAKKNGKVHVIFSVSGTSAFNIDLSHFPDGDIAGEWYRVRGGTWNGELSISNSASQSVTPPEDVSILLVKKSRSKGVSIITVTGN
jgi:hypothetical protein